MRVKANPFTPKPRKQKPREEPFMVTIDYQVLAEARRRKELLRIASGE
jgi:hypothetical protein